jgi:DNA-binding protein YbaB
VDGRDWLTSYRERVAEIAARAARANEELAATAATVTSREGAVTVTVGSAGALQSLEFSERAEELDRSQLAAAVLDAARRAHAEAARRALRAVGPTLGADSEAISLLRAHLPDGA